jgi:hypothetical protein
MGRWQISTASQQWWRGNKIEKRDFAGPEDKSPPGQHMHIIPVTSTDSLL